MLTDAFQEANPGMNIRYRIDRRLFNLRRLQAKTKVHVDKLRDFLFADDSTLNAVSAKDMQHSMDLFSNACSNFRHTISMKKTEVMYQPARKNPYQEPTVTVNGQKPATVDKFVYLGSTLSRSVHIDDETHARIAKTSFAFGHHTTINKRDLDSIPEARQETQPISPQQPLQTAQSEVAGQSPRY